MGTITIIFSLLMVLSFMMISTATILFWVDIGGKIGPYRRKLSIIFAIIGWALYFLVMMPVL